MSFSLDVVVMAAGQGTRMKSLLPKVLQRLAGRALVQHVIDCAAQLVPRSVLVVTGRASAEQIKASLSAPAQAAGSAAGLSLQYVVQDPPLGTGHAVQQAAGVMPDDGVTLVLSGDVPLTEPSTLQALLDVCKGRHLALLTLELADPSGYGRIVRAAPNASEPQGAVQAIVEHRDASDAQRRIGEIYSGIMAVPTPLLKRWLARLDNHNAQGEYYLTDVVRLATAEGHRVRAHRITDPLQVAGVNTPRQLAALERAYQRRRADALLDQGVRLADPERIDVRGQLICGQDVEIDVNCVFEGRVELGQGVRIGPNCCIANAVIEDGAQLQAYTHVQGHSAGVRVGPGAKIGPFARLRPGTTLGPAVCIGNFVEVKNSTLGAGSKANHLAYLGDADVGERVNYGAGSITANYDGANKHRSVIENDVHVGSNCVLVTPITLGAGSTIGAGSTLRSLGPQNKTPAGALVVEQGRLITIEHWQRPAKKGEK